MERKAMICQDNSKYDIHKTAGLYQVAKAKQFTF
jgi:hypothetical protein